MPRKNQCDICGKILKKGEIIACEKCYEKSLIPYYNYLNEREERLEPPNIARIMHLAKTLPDPFEDLPDAPLEEELDLDTPFPRKTQDIPF